MWSWWFFCELWKQKVVQRQFHVHKAQSSEWYWGSNIIFVCLINKLWQEQNKTLNCTEKQAVSWACYVVCMRLQWGLLRYREGCCFSLRSLGDELATYPDCNSALALKDSRERLHHLRKLDCRISGDRNWMSKLMFLSHVHVAVGEKTFDPHISRLNISLSSCGLIASRLPRKSLECLVSNCRAYFFWVALWVVFYGLESVLWSRVGRPWGNSPDRSRAPIVPDLNGAKLIICLSVTHTVAYNPLSGLLE